jgi:predicted ATPase
MITRFYIDNFKSLVDFDLELAKFNCLIGLNGAGKSTVLQALDFVSHWMTQGGVEKWLELRDWNMKDVKSSLTKNKHIKIVLEIKLNDGTSNANFRWEATFNPGKMCCINEKLVVVGFPVSLFESDGKRYSICQLYNQKPLAVFESVKYEEFNCCGKSREKIYYKCDYYKDIDFEYQGSLLSQLTDHRLGDFVRRFKQELSRLRAFDSFSPDCLRVAAKKDEQNDKQDIGINGTQIAKFIRDLKQEEKDSLLKSLQGYYPQVTEIITKLNRATDSIELEIVEQYSPDSKPVRTKADHINDGLLRTLALLAEQYSPLETLLFDEIENGINPEVTEKVVDALVSSPKQIIVTTHSPMILNYMSDEVAKEAVTLIYKNSHGHTHATRFFNVPSAAKKLTSLAPGDAMLDLYLQEVAQEAEATHAQ